MKQLLLTLSGAGLIVCASASSLHAAAFMVDFGRNPALNAPTQAGFEVFEFDNTGPNTLSYANALASDGTIEVTISNNTHYRDYNPITGGAFVSQSDLLSDNVLRNAIGTMRMTLSDLNPGTYQITTYHHSTQFGNSPNMTVDLTDSVVTGQNVLTGSTSHGTTPASITSATFNFTTDGSDVFIDVSKNDAPANTHAVLNGFELDVIPEPSSAALLGLGGLALLRRRRK